jgi:competence protein ComEC
VIGSRLPALAVGFTLGVALAGAAGPLHAAPLPWLALAAGCGLAALRPGARAAAWALACALAVGALARALAPPPASLVPAALAAEVGDRRFDRIVGVVRGPVDDTPGARRFALALDGHAAPVVEIAARGRPAVLPGDRLAVRGPLHWPRGYWVPGADDPARRLAARGAALSMSAVELEVVGRAPSWWRAAVSAQRAIVAAIAARGGDPAGVAIVRAMVAGDRGALEPRVTERFRDAGISHVLSVSGLHLAATALLVFAAVRRAWASVPALALRWDASRVAALVALPAAVAFTAVSGAQPSTVRALVVVAVALLGAALGRRPRLADSLGVAAILILTVSPASLYDPSLQLSFAATAALAWLSGARRLRWPLHGAVVSLWISLALAPLTVVWFGTVPVAAAVANALAIPVAELIVLPLGLAGASLTAVWEQGGGWLLDLAIAAAAALDRWAGWLARLAPPLALPAPDAFEALAWAAVVAGGLWLARRPSRRGAALLAGGAVALAASIGWQSAVAPRLRGELVVSFLDVGQGDAAVVELPGGETWLIDAGGLPFAADPERLALPGERALLPYLRERRIDRIELVVLSHPHPDHYAGLAALADELEIDEVWAAAPHPERPEPLPYRRLMARLAARGAQITVPPLGVARSAGGARLEVLAPRYDGGRARADPVSSANDNSLVVRLGFAGRHVLFTGDLEAEGEDLLVAAATGLSAEVVKVPHHGSATSSSARLIAAVSATWAVISCGPANRFGFPDRDVVERWRRSGARVVRTDSDGSIRVAVAADGAVSVERYSPARGWRPAERAPP